MTFFSIIAECFKNALGVKVVTENREVCVTDRKTYYRKLQISTFINLMDRSTLSKYTLPIRVLNKP